MIEDKELEQAFDELEKEIIDKIKAEAMG